MRKLDQDFKSIWCHFTEDIPPLILDFTVFAGSYSSKLMIQDISTLFSESDDTVADVSDRILQNYFQRFVIQVDKGTH